jgi:hypothetical protein
MLPSVQVCNQRSRQYSSGSVTIGFLGRPGIRRINTDVFFGIIVASSAYSESENITGNQFKKYLEGMSPSQIHKRKAWYKLNSINNDLSV